MLGLATGRCRSTFRPLLWQDGLNMLKVPGCVRPGPRLDGSGDFGVRSALPDGSKMLLVQRGVRLVQRNGRALRRTSNIFQPAGRDEGTPTSPFRSSRWTGRTLPRTINMVQPSRQTIGVKVQRQRPVARHIDKDNQQGLSTSGHIRNPIGEQPNALPRQPQVAQAMYEDCPCWDSTPL